jgi:competence protein ComEA
MKRVFALVAMLLWAAVAWAAEPVNVNTATAEEISENLKGVGLSKAQAIVAYREANGAFLHVDELVNVKGIGLKTIDQNRAMILLSDGQAPAAD